MLLFEGGPGQPFTAWLSTLLLAFFLTLAAQAQTGGVGTPSPEVQPPADEHSLTLNFKDADIRAFIGAVVRSGTLRRPGALQHSRSAGRRLSWH